MQGIKSMQIYSWKRMESKALICIAIWSWNFRSEFIWIGRCEFWRANQRDGWRRAVQASLGIRRASGPGRPFSWPAKSCLGHVAWSWSVGVVRDVGGEISSEFAPCALRDLPHTYSCTCFYSTKQRCKQARTLPVVNTGESKLLLNKYLKKPKFLLFF